MDNRDRKAMEMGVQTLIYIALGLVILTVSLVVYFNAVSDSSDTIRACENLGGECTSRTECTTQGGTMNSLGACGEEMVCCRLPE